MISRNSLMGAMLCALILVASVATAPAQVAFTNPPCGVVNIINNHAACTALVTFNTIPAGAWPPAVIPPGGAFPYPVPGGGIIVNGITSTGGFAYNFNPPPPPAGVFCGPFSWWISHVTLSPFPPPPNCCFDVCADPCACTITLNPSPVPPACNP